MRKQRSDKIINNIKDEVIYLLENTTLTYPQIGEKFGCSGGPIYKIKKDYNISRPPEKGRKRDKIKCNWCKTLMRDIKSKNRETKHKFCSKNCYTLWQKSEDNKGSNNPGWKGGKETKLQLLRKTNDWKIWREQVFKRDNYTCKKCGNIGGILHPHHYIPKSIDISKVYDITNGITLCSTCHLEIHRTKNLSYMKTSHKSTNQYNHQ